MSLKEKLMVKLQELRNIVTCGDDDDIGAAVDTCRFEVQTRSGWEGHPKDYTPKEFRVDFGEGVVIVGILDDQAQPVSATFVGITSTAPTAVLLKFCSFIQFDI